MMVRRGGGLQAAVFFFRAFGSSQGGLETTPTSKEKRCLHLKVKL